MKILLILFLLLLLTQSLSAQTVDSSFSIHVRARSAASVNEFLVDINQRQGQIKIIYHLKDSASEAELNKNEHYNAMLSKFASTFMQDEPDKALLASLRNKLDSIKISTFTKDSIAFNTVDNTPYANLIKKVSAASKEQLENEEANKGRIVLDGTSFVFNVKSSSESKTVYASSPKGTSHPLLFELIHNTMNLYREEKSNTFLSKEWTNGY